MAEIQLPDELVKKVIESMVGKLVEDGINYNLRNAIEDVIKERLISSGILDTIADKIFTRILSDQDAIITQASDAIIAGIGDALAKGYKASAKEIVNKIKDYAF